MIEGESTKVKTEKPDYQINRDAKKQKMHHVGAFSVKIIKILIGRRASV
jgi:hypothetical protein